MEEFSRIQEKYTAEAQKRLRPDGTAQYQVLSQSDSNHLRHLVDDIWADHASLDALPSPIKSGDCPKFLIIGAGMGGLVSAVRLIQAGFTADQIRIIDTAGGIGGTWYWNRYPGLHCDIESYIYLPLLEEMGYMPSHKYIPGVEIRHYLNDIVKRWDLKDKILLRTKADKVEWDDGARLWKVDLTTQRGPTGAENVSLTVKAEFVLLTAGLLTRPQIPRLPGAGIDGFKGDLFHTSLWNYAITGGSSEDTVPVLSKLEGKRVGIIGTGATAIQVVPYLAKHAKEVYVFQRTPSGVYARNQRATDPEEWKKVTAQPGWELERNKNFASHISGSASPGTPDLVNDEWSKQPAYSALVGDEKFALVAPEKIPEVIGYFMARDAENSARLRARIATIVKDEETAKKLTPWYPAWCKRNTFSDTYLQTFNEPHVHLIDTDGRGVDGATAHSIVANGQEYPLDILVLSTGYQSPAVLENAAARADIKLFGRGGKTIPESWASTGTATLHGYASHGFPNLFWLSPSQTGVGANHAFTLDTQCRHIAYVVATAHKRVGGLTKGGLMIEVEEAAQEAWSQRIVQGAGRFATMAICTPSYINNEGHIMDPNASPEEMVKRARASPYSGGIVRFLKELDTWREGDKLSGIEVTIS
ncbi:FAD/NAD(P)-binding domain-containing protein [Annulohypoxylon maeteangense]|uniref:FAD/NAD(P)-binding domain-containing protein n=1 Tax=Annulohypoxylon maeteangense TaxID=1927788 RepID=UPI002008211B|nr:FAD/NAD(P)-binding domain-containing protein [Annulohypoxylon maeteangense]KAI0880310.1 FAD/NAD(P)-binding domain-containing protein [Annulohypoxylon maeteangense]